MELFNQSESKNLYLNEENVGTQVEFNINILMLCENVDYIMSAD